MKPIFEMISSFSTLQNVGGLGFTGVLRSLSYFVRCYRQFATSARNLIYNVLCSIPVTK
jgi:hypothetical protein